MMITSVSVTCWYDHYGHIVYLGPPFSRTLEIPELQLEFVFPSFKYECVRALIFLLLLFCCSSWFTVAFLVVVKVRWLQVIFGSDLSFVPAWVAKFTKSYCLVHCEIHHIFWLCEKKKERNILIRRKRKKKKGTFGCGTKPSSRSTTFAPSW